ncbi:hypothetical protein SISNIDRAFT_387649, partial [Sistotremastrum niveocremeum HHB9708]
TYDKTPLNTISRYTARASYDKETIKSIIAEAKIGHVSWVDDEGLPQCLPMLGAVEDIDGDLYLYFHGYARGRFTKALDEKGTRVVVTFSILDGYVLALSHYSTDLNYRSAILHGYTLPFGSLSSDSSPSTPPLSSTKAEKLRNVVEGAIPGRWDHARLPTETEVNSTGLIRVLVESGSAKVRGGGVKNEKKDLEDGELVKRVWTGVVP